MFIVKSRFIIVMILKLQNVKGKKIFKSNWKGNGDYL